MKCPCKDCLDRTMTCHGVCDRYKAWKKWYEEMKAAQPDRSMHFSEQNQRVWWRNLKKWKKHRTGR